MNAMRRRLGRLATLLGAVALLWACNAPFIPVPPPGANFTSQLVDDGAGGQKTMWQTHGLPSQYAANAYFYIFNDRLQTGVIVVARPDGTYDSPAFDGMMDDRIRISYQPPSGDTYSDSLCLLLTTAVVAGGSAPLCPSP